MKKVYLILAIFVLTLNSCGKFLTEYSQSLSYIINTDDLDELLMGEAYLTPSNSDYHALWFLTAMSDELTTISYKNNLSPRTGAETLQGCYTWQPEPFLDQVSSTSAGSPEAWNIFYERLAATNTIIVEAERFKDDEKYNRIKGEAHFIRAYYYFLMVNIWGKPYSATSSTDLGIPIKTTEYIEAKDFERNTVQECYDQIILDLNIAIEHLEGEALVSTWRAGITAARGLLGRVYLYMANYEKAEEQLDIALNDNSFYMYDMPDKWTSSTASAWSKVHRDDLCSEVIFAGGISAISIFNTQGLEFTVDDEQIQLYETGDLRYINKTTDTGFFDYYKSSTKIQFRPWIAGQNTSHFSGLGVSYPEVVLNKAEAAAMQGKDAEAIEAIRIIHEARFATAPTITLSGEELVNYVRDERRRELCYRYHRWFDLRRYAVAPKYPFTKSIKHVLHHWDENNSQSVAVGFYELLPYGQDGAWVMAIPPDAIDGNNGALVPNERPIREMKDMSEY